MCVRCLLLTHSKSSWCVCAVYFEVPTIKKLVILWLCSYCLVIFLIYRPLSPLYAPTRRHWNDHNVSVPWQHINGRDTTGATNCYICAILVDLVVRGIAKVDVFWIKYFTVMSVWHIMSAGISWCANIMEYNSTTGRHYVQN